MAKRFRRATVGEALAAARRLGMSMREIEILGKALAPLTPAEIEEIRRANAALVAARGLKAAVDLEWKNMSFAEWSERRKNGTLPPTTS